MIVFILCTEVLCDQFHVLCLISCFMFVFVLIGMILPWYGTNKSEIISTFQKVLDITHKIWLSRNVTFVLQWMVLNGVIYIVNVIYTGDICVYKHMQNPSACSPNKFFNPHHWLW